MRRLSHQQIFMLEKGNFTCSDVEKLYGDYFDRELPASLRGKLDAHIATCDVCQEFVATYALTVRVAKELRVPKITTEIQNRLRKRLNAELNIELPPIKEF